MGRHSDGSLRPRTQPEDFGVSQRAPGVSRNKRRAKLKALNEIYEIHFAVLEVNFISLSETKVPCF